MFVNLFITVQIEKFWSDDSNKEYLQEIYIFFFRIILRAYLSNKSDSSKCIQKINGVTNERPDFDNHVEEESMRIISHNAK